MTLRAGMLQALAGRRAVVLLVLTGTGMVLLAQTRVWASGSARLASAATTTLTVDGGSAAPGVGALALVAGAGAVVLATAGRGVLRVAAALVGVAGLALVTLVVWLQRGGRAVLDSAVTAATGTTGLIDPAQGPVAWTGWPVLAEAGGLLMVTAAVLAWRHAAAWSAPSVRYERRRAPSPDRPADPWDALTRGDDPTTGPG